MEQQIQNQKPKLSPKDFFLYVGLVVTLLISSISLLNLIFESINSIFPDKIDYYVDPYSGGIRWAIASLFIIFPVYVFISWLIKKDVKMFPEKLSLGVRKWLIYLTLFIAGATVITDLIVLINTFLGGEITTRFILKVLSVIVIAGGIFSYYFYDLKDRDEKIFKWWIIATSAVVALSLVLGFYVMGSPLTQRLKRMDADRINSLTQIQWQVINYWQKKGELPKDINELNDPISGFIVPTDPETEIPYQYEAIGDKMFKLCANFSLENDKLSAIPAKPRYVSPENENWFHKQGQNCFERKIDPELYPTIKDEKVRPQ